MNRTYFILGCLVIAQIVWGIAIYQQSQANDDLAHQVSVLGQRLQSANKQISVLKDEGDKRLSALQESVKALGVLPSAAEIASTLTSGNAPVYNAIADRLKADAAFKKVVKGDRGPAGPPPKVEEVAGFLTNCCVGGLVELLWQRGRSEVFKNEALIAAVAQKVHDTYGKSMKGVNGRDGASPAPQDVAKALSTDIGFAQLVADMKRQ